MAMPGCVKMSDLVYRMRQTSGGIPAIAQWCMGTCKILSRIQSEEKIQTCLGCIHR